ncbi:hypothetical protein OQA88_1378 [Cercophora sp. LCS_1]
MPAHHSYITLPSGIKIFYRHAGPANAPLLLLLHGYPSSSHMFRNLIPLLSAKYRIIAPDLPGFGFTTVPPSLNYTYTFSSLSSTLASFIETLSLPPFALYIFDYGAPTGLRLALTHPDKILAIITQNGNAYAEGLSPTFWAPLFSFWKTDGSASHREKLTGVTELAFTKWQYLTGEPDTDKIQPEAWTLDQALLDGEGNKDVQLDLFYDYRTNVEKYGEFQAYFRRSGVPVLAAWGKNDECFIPAGAEAYAKDVQKLELRWLDAGHFALEANNETMAGWIEEFLVKYEVF